MNEGEGNMIHEITDKHIFVKVPNSVGQLLDGVYLKSKDVWRLPLNLGALRELYMQGYDVGELGKKLSKKYDEVVSIKTQPVEIKPSELLRPYQLQDIKFLWNRQHAGVFNQQRTGKTPTVCKFLDYLKVRTIIVVPASLILNWRDELQKWTSLKVHPVMGTKVKKQRIYKQFFEEGGALVLSKETLRNDIDLIQSLNYECVVVDEAHFLRNYNSKQSKAIYQLGKYAKRRYALTGTPATKSPADVYGILHFLDPQQWSSYWQFVERYFDVKDKYFGGKDIGDFKNDLRKKEYTEILNLVSVQRKRADVMKWLPKKQYQTIKLPMEKVQQKAYDDMFNMFEVEEVGLDAINVLAQSLRLRQITSVPSALGLQTYGIKAAFIKEWLEDNEDEQLVIFSNFSSGLKEIAHFFGTGAKIPVGIIIGEVSKEDRQKQVELFQKGKLRILFCNIEAAGTGLTLDAAGTVIFLDRHHNPTQNEQAEDRIIATTENSNLSSLVIDLVCENSIDEVILEIVKQKKDFTEVANNYKNIKDWLKV